MKKWIAMLLCLCALLACAGCKPQKTDKADIMGQWRAPGVDATVEFKEDGTAVLEFDGLHKLTWTYDEDKNSFRISGAKVGEASVVKKDDMQCLSMLDIEFYRTNDYDRAFANLVNERTAEIAKFTQNMEKIQLSKAYDIANGVTIEFTEVNQHPSNTGLTVSYIIYNSGEQAIEDGLASDSKGKGYFANSQKAADLGKEFRWAERLGAGESYEDILVLMHHDYIQGTLNRFGKVIGAITFEFDGKNYYFDLTELLK